MPENGNVRARIGAGEIISRIIFGGFWAAVTLGLAVAGFAVMGNGHAGGGLVSLGAAVLTGLYSAYIFRGGRVRFLFW